MRAQKSHKKNLTKRLNNAIDNEKGKKRICSFTYLSDKMNKLKNIRSYKYAQ